MMKRRILVTPSDLCARSRLLSPSRAGQDWAAAYSYLRPADFIVISMPSFGLALPCPPPRRPIASINAFP